MRALTTYVAARILPAFSSMLLTMLCIQVLKPEDYAAYSLTLLAAGVAAGFVGGVSGQAMLRYAHELSPSALNLALIGFPLLAATLTCPLVLTYFAVRGNLTSAALLATAALPLIALLDTRRSLFVARARAGAAFALDAWRAGLGLLFAAALLLCWGPYVAAPLLAQLLSVVACLLLVRPQRTEVPAWAARHVDRRYVGYGVGLAAWSAVIVGLSLAERSVLADVVGMSASGRYAAQADVINAVFSAGAGALASTMMPAYLAQSQKQELAALYRLRRLALLGIVAIALLCLLLGTLLALVKPGRIAQAVTSDVPTGFVLVLAGAVWAAAGFVQKPVELRGQTYRLAAGVVLVLVLFLLIAPALADRFAAFGVAAARLIAGCGYAALALAAARPTR